MIQGGVLLSYATRAIKKSARLNIQISSVRSIIVKFKAEPLLTVSVQVGQKK